MNIWEKILNEPINSIENGLPILASGQPLTKAQLRSIQTLLDNGVPEVIDEAAVDFEAERRILAIAPEHSQRNAIARSVELTEILASGGMLTAEQETERAHLRGLWAAVSAIRAASNSINSGDLPANYEALVDAFDSELT